MSILDTPGKTADELMDGSIHLWSGGPCPLPDGTKVQVWLRVAEPECGDADQFDWTDVGGDYDIIAFQVQCKPAVNAIWVNEYSNGHMSVWRSERDAIQCAARDAVRIAVRYVEESR